MISCDQTDRQFRNFHEMTARLGVDLMDLSQQCLGHTLLSALRRCRACEAGDVCTDWLARAAPVLEKAPPFCPNADVFARSRRIERTSVADLTAAA